MQVNSYDKLNRIGEGAYGTVYRAIDKQTDSIVALKKVRGSRRRTGAYQYYTYVSYSKLLFYRKLKWCT